MKSQQRSGPDGNRDFQYALRRDEHRTQTKQDAVEGAQLGRENLLPYGAMAFNAFGPRNALTERSMAHAASAIEWVARACHARRSSPVDLARALSKRFRAVS